MPTSLIADERQGGKLLVPTVALAETITPMVSLKNTLIVKTPWPLPRPYVLSIYNLPAAGTVDLTGL